jgi:hypothetical protein
MKQRNTTPTLATLSISTVATLGSVILVIHLII